MHNVRLLTLADQGEARRALEEIGVDAGGVAWMAPKATHRILKVDNLSPQAAIILKQEMLSRGGEAALHRDVITGKVERTSVLLMGTVKQYTQLCQKLKLQPFGLARLAEEIREVLGNAEKKFSPLSCRGYTLPLGERTLVMGILNVTPDSFSDGGKFLDVAAAVEHAKRMVEEGADIIDIGGESTRLQANPATYLPPELAGKWHWSPLPVEEELRRVLPVLERLLAEVKVPISVDTYKAETARAVLEAGAHMINDVWGLQFDPRLAEVVAAYDVPVVVMHNQNHTHYNDLLGDIIAYLRKSIEIASRAGIKPERIIVDPGIGFGKTLEQNLEVLRRLEELKTLGKPILLGTSRKSVIGKVLGLPVEERLEGTAATVAWGVAKGASIVRVHDVKEMVRVVRMVDAIMRPQPPEEP